jgi:AbiV family abortive infection protein
MVHLESVKSTAPDVLASAAAAAERNAADLLDGAELLTKAHHAGRAVALAALAVEEVGKALSFSALAGMSTSQKAQAPVGRMLEWHALKAVTGDFIAVSHAGPPDGAAWLLTMPEGDIAALLRSLGEYADDASRMRRQGLYLDVDRTGITRPAGISDADAARQLDRAREATAGAAVLLDPARQALLTHPPVESAALARAAVGALTVGGLGRTPDDAVAVVAESIAGLVEAFG